MKKWWLSCVLALCLLCAAALADAPVIVTHPSDATAPVGEKATFTVAATGDSDLSYQWQVLLPGEDDWRKTSAPGYATAQLTVQVTAGMEGRRYRCIVTDASGLWASSRSAVLHVGSAAARAADVAPSSQEHREESTLSGETQPVLDIIAQPANATVDDGGDAVFVVVAQGTGLSYQWQTLVPGEDKWRNSTMRGNRTDTMQFSAPAWQSGRKYRCVITDGEGNSLISDEVLLTVRNVPVVLAITAQPENQTVAEGEEAVFAVAATGRGLAYRWQTLADAEKGWQDTSLSGFDTPTLRLTVRAAQDGRQFRCTVTDREGESITSEPAALTVDFPRLKTQPADLTVEPGTVVAFLAEAEGDGPFTYRWQTLADEGTGWQATALPGYDTDTLSFTAEMRHNSRQYRCVVTFPDGRRVTSDPALLTVALPAGPALTLQPADLTVGVGQEAGFTVAVAEDAGEVSYQWEVSVDEGESWVASSLAGCHTDTLTFTAGLHQQGRLFRCVVTDAAGGVTESEAAKLTVSE